MGNMVNFISCVFHHNKNHRKDESIQQGPGAQVRMLRPPAGEERGSALEGTGAASARADSPLPSAPRDHLSCILPTGLGTQGPQVPRFTAALCKCPSIVNEKQRGVFTHWKTIHW